MAGGKVSFNPRTYIRYDILPILYIRKRVSFNPRTYIRYDKLFRIEKREGMMFQSTYLYKVRRFRYHLNINYIGFNPRTYIRYDIGSFPFKRFFPCFNPRTYIRYDCRDSSRSLRTKFQSTYLYKVRLHYK